MTKQTPEHNPFDLGAPHQDGYNIANANTNSKQTPEWEKTRRDIEKHLWSIYNDNYSPNMEEASEHILSLFSHFLPKADLLAEIEKAIKKERFSGAPHALSSLASWIKEN